MAGFARALRYLPLREDLIVRYGGGMNAQKQAIEQIRPGEVLVIDARQEPAAGTIGDILALRPQARGAAGIVTDGVVVLPPGLAPEILADARDQAWLGEQAS